MSEPTILTRDQVRHALQDLADWSGDEHQITRTVVLPRDRYRPLLDAIDLIDPRTRTDVEEQSITFTLFTQSLGRVTDRDLDLARRIDAAVDAAGSGG